MHLHAASRMCKTPEIVTSIIYLIRKHSYVTYSKKSSMLGEEFKEWTGERTENAVYKVNTLKNTKYYKLYERGPDGKAKKDVNGIKYWDYKDINRARIEHTFKGVYLKRFGLVTLDDLINDLHFSQIFFRDKPSKDLIQFKYFDHNRLPKPWHIYKAEDGHGNDESFMEQYFDAKVSAGITNPGQHIKDHPLFAILKDQIRKAIEGCDERWLSKSRQ